MTTGTRFGVQCGHTLTPENSVQPNSFLLCPHDRAGAGSPGHGGTGRQRPTGRQVAFANSAMLNAADIDPVIAKDYVPPWARGDFDFYQVGLDRSITSLAQQGAMGRQPFAVAGAFDDDLVAGVGQAVQSAVAEDGVVEETEPFVHGPVAGDDKAG